MYPTHALSLEANADSEKSIRFYERIGMKIQKIVTLEEDGEKCEFAIFETPLDIKGKKIDLALDPKDQPQPIHPYFSTVEEYRAFEEESSFSLDVSKSPSVSEQSI